MLTEFGKFTRGLRIERKELIIEMSDKLDIPMYTLSHIEIGKEPVPNGLIEKVEEIYGVKYTGGR